MSSEPSRSEAPLGDTVYMNLRDLLRSGALGPGQRVSEADLCERFAVSRTPVREAIGRLLNEGFLATGPGGRTIVSEIDVERAEEIYDMREAVECLAAKLAAKKAATADLIELHGIIVEQREGVANENEFLTINDRFHGCIYRISGNRYVQRMAEVLLVSAEMIRGTTIGRYDYETWSLVDHEAIYQAIEDGDSAAAEEAARKHTRRGRFQRIALLTDATLE